MEMPKIPQSDEDVRFALEDLATGCATGIYEKVSRYTADVARRAGAIISSSFVVWQEGSSDPRSRFVVNLSTQSRHWKKGTVRMESVAEFGMSLQQGDHMISMDIEKGYRHFRLAPGMRDWFIFRYGTKYYLCIAVPFGWGRSPLWFTQLMAPFVRTLREWGYLVLAYLDYFLIVPSGWDGWLQHETVRVLVQGSTTFCDNWA